MKANNRPAGFDPASWTWYGNAGHFICGRWCRFHLTTKVGLWLVSTVGEYVHPRHSRSERAEAEWLTTNFPGEDIGYERKYETMVFLAGAPCAAKGCGCGLPQISGQELDMRGYMTGGDARAGHMELCNAWSMKRASDAEVL